MAFTVASRENAAIGARSGITHASLHTAAAGTTGANEASGGSPAYARKAITFTDGAVDGSTVGSQVVFDVPSGTYVEIGFWTAATGGTFVASLPLSSNATVGSQQQVAVTPTISAS